MKFIIALALVAVAAARPDDGFHYDAKYDNFDVPDVMANERLLKNYIYCFLGTGKCTSEGNDIKKWIPEAIQTSCGKCTDRQKVLVAEFIRGIKAKRPEDWEALKKQNDPNNEHNDKIEEFLAKY